MKKLLATGLFTMLISTSVFAVHLDGKYPVCVSEDAFDRLSAIFQHKDEEAFKEIMSSECFMPKNNLPVDDIVSMGWASGVSHVKIYMKGKLYDLWTNSENVKAD